MLFGALFSTYIILRLGAPVWPHGLLNVWLGMFNTFVLIGSSVTMVMAWASLKMGDWGKHRLFLLLTLALSAVFLVVKYFEYSEHLTAGEGPWHNTFFAIYFTLTGLHGLHIVGGMIVMLYFIGPGAKMFRKNPEQFTNRIEYTGLYWHFVDLVWIILFTIVYLI
jgi:heme/copper-type cytochrome/quinol oxidase subunit 3